MLLSLAQSLQVVLYGAALVGAGLLVAAGASERRGDLVASRRRARLGGFVMAGATLTALPVGTGLLALAPQAAKDAILGEVSPMLLLATATVVTMTAGFVGLLAGLTGKPRPGGYFAALLVTAGVAGLVVALLPAF